MEYIAQVARDLWLLVNEPRPQAMPSQLKDGEKLWRESATGYFKHSPLIEVQRKLITNCFKSDLNVFQALHVGLVT